MLLLGVVYNTFNGVANNKKWCLMKIQLHFEMNSKLYIKDPENTELGKKIVLNSIRLIYDIGFEDFNFKKLAMQIGSTEASIYRYFENKHKLLIYLTSWYWNWLEYQLSFQTKNIKDPKDKIKLVINLITTTCENEIGSSHIDEVTLHRLMVREGTKVYFTHNVSEDNKDQLFKPYKDVCKVISNIILDCDPKYEFSKSLASTIVEIAHFQTFFKNNLPALTDFGLKKTEADVIRFLESLVFSALKI